MLNAAIFSQTARMQAVAKPGKTAEICQESVRRCIFYLIFFNNTLMKPASISLMEYLFWMTRHRHWPTPCSPVFPLRNPCMARQGIAVFHQGTAGRGIGARDFT